MPAPALMLTVVSALDIVVSVPPEGLAASQSTLAVLTPEQAARTSEPWPIAIDETPASSAAAMRPLGTFAITTNPAWHAGENTGLVTCRRQFGRVLQHLDRECLLTQRMELKGAAVSPDYPRLWQSGTSATLLSYELLVSYLAP